MLAELNQVTSLISSLPGIGRKSAQRIALHLLKQDSSYIEHFIEGLRNFHNNVVCCTECGALQSIHQRCDFCGPSRDTSSLCIVEQPSDIFAIESTGEHQGLYHVLGGVLSPLDGVNPEDLTLDALKSRVEKLEKLNEIIIATNPSVEGNATAHYIAQLLEASPHLKITRLASGLALGSQLEYADSQAISLSFRARVLFDI